jgi:hypothetical protein
VTNHTELGFVAMQKIASALTTLGSVLGGYELVLVLVM